jgi:quercetin dioxygenase-like cupin family protein
MIEIDLGVVHHFSDGVYAKQMTLPANHYAVKHSHSYDHLSILAQGLVSVNVDGEVTEYRAPACISIKAGTKHMIVAHEDSVWFCIHATDQTDAEGMDEVLIRG